MLLRLLIVRVACESYVRGPASDDDPKRQKLCAGSDPYLDPLQPAAAALILAASGDVTRDIEIKHSSCDI